MKRTGKAQGKQGLMRTILALIKDRCLYLLLSLVVLILVYPYTSSYPVLILAFNSLTIIGGVYAVSAAGRHIVFASVVAVLHVFCFAAGYFTASSVIRTAGLSLLALFYLYTFVRVIDYVFQGKEATGDKIFGAISAYLLLGLAWSILYSITFSLQPGAFTVSSLADGRPGGPDFVYFSFITLLTVGYGDITPISGIARSLAILEGVAGVMYIGVFIARIVSLYRREPHQ